MSPEPRVRCTACAYVWNSAAMAEGLALLGACPRCRGELDFLAPAPAPASPEGDEPPTGLAPHRVLGLPRL